MSGYTGHRCMAGSVMLMLKGTDAVVRRLVEHARQMRPGKDLGPVISAQAKQRIEGYIQEAVDAGAQASRAGSGSVEGAAHRPLAGDLSVLRDGTLEGERFEVGRDGAVLRLGRGFPGCGNRSGR
jgi:acyl-CoA reductase-like NAD-dependent aldehyde dehydrogenase